MPDSRPLWSACNRADRTLLVPHKRAPQDGVYCMGGLCSVNSACTCIQLRQGIHACWLGC